MDALVRESFRGNSGLVRSLAAKIVAENSPVVILLGTLIAESYLIYITQFGSVHQKLHQR